MKPDTEEKILRELEAIRSLMNNMNLTLDKMNESVSIFKVILEKISGFRISNLLSSSEAKATEDPVSFMSRIRAGREKEKEVAESLRTLRDRLKSFESAFSGAVKSKSKNKNRSNANEDDAQKT